MSEFLKIVKGKIKQPFAVFLYAIEGLGKTTWASHALRAIFLGAEETGELNIDRFPSPKSFQEALDQLNWLITSNHTYATLVIDTIDSIEKLLHQKIIAEDPKQAGSMAKAQGGYGNAYDMAEKEMIKFRDKLKTLRDQKGMNIIILGHAKKKTATDTVIGMVYDTYESNLHEKAQAVFIDWVQAVLFGTFITYASKDKNTDKTFAMGDGERVLFTSRRPGFRAKNRYDLPFQIPLDFDVFYKGYEDFYNQKVRTPDEVIKNIIGLCENITDETRKKKISDLVEKNKTDIKGLEKLEQQVRQVVGA